MSSTPSSKSRSGKSRSGKSHSGNPPAQNAKFVTGSTMRHVLVMASTGAIGLISIFFVDILNLFYISMLGQQELAAAIGYASTIIFFSISFSVGFTIASAAITGREIGKGNQERARQFATGSLLITLVFGILIALFLYAQLQSILSLLGAKGETAQLAADFMYIVIPSIPVLCVSMGLSGILRAVGDAKRSMYVTLVAAVSAAILDPLLIFGLDLGLTGAAISAFVVRFIMLAVGWYGAYTVHKMLAKPNPAEFRSLLRPYWAIAFPAVMTQIATPIGNAYVTRAISDFGDDAVAGWAIVGRLVPLAFAALYSLSGAVGPILSQNYGAGRKDRIMRTMRDSLIFTAAYSIAMWAILAFFSPWIVKLFRAQGDAADMIVFFCLFVAGSFIFNGALFVANAAFNNLDYPILSTVFNWGRATLGIIPFVYIGANYGPNGVIAGWGIGGVVFGIASMATCLYVMAKIPEKPDPDHESIPAIPSANSPFTSGKGASFSQE